jgi:hypothetical protein
MPLNYIEQVISTGFIFFNSIIIPHYNLQLISTLLKLMKFLIRFACVLIFNPIQPYSWLRKSEHHLHVDR